MANTLLSKISPFVCICSHHPRAYFDSLTICTAGKHKYDIFREQRDDDDHDTCNGSGSHTAVPLSRATIHTFSRWKEGEARIKYNFDYERSLEKRRYLRNHFGALSCVPHLRLYSTCRNNANCICFFFFFLFFFLFLF